MAELFAIAAIALLWNFLNGELTVVNTLVGGLIGLLIIGVMERGRRRTLPRRLWAVLYYLLNFIFDLMLAGLQIAILTLTPKPRYRPQVMAVPLRLRSDGAISLLMLTASLIPGSVPMHVADDGEGGKILFAHAINARTPEVARRSIRRIESLILEFAE